MGLDMGAAVSRFEAAKDLATPGHPQRPGILLRFGETAPYISRPGEAVAALDEALETLRRSDDWEATGRALWIKARALWERGESDDDVARQCIDVPSLRRMRRRHRW